MDLSIYMAFTGAELDPMLQYNGKTAWLGCHLSASGEGVATHPPSIRHCDLLVMTDEIPLEDHRPEIAADSLCTEAANLYCERILLDFQRQPTEESQVFIDCLLEKACIPVGVSALHAQNFSCPVFLPPSPLWASLENALLPWKGREIWVELAPEDGCVTLTTEGSYYAECSAEGIFPFYDSALFLTYRTEVSSNHAKVYLHRGQSHLHEWLNHANMLGIHTAIGLYQQLRGFSQNTSLHSTKFMV